LEYRWAISQIFEAGDGSESAEIVLPYLRAMARTFDSEVTLLAVPETESETPRLEHYLTSVVQALRARGFRARSTVTGSGAARTILAVSREERVDLIMMATRGRGGIAGKDGVGSVTERVVESTPCPVFLAPVQTLAKMRLAAVGLDADERTSSKDRGAYP